jgi:hypothetical protein
VAMMLGMGFMGKMSLELRQQARLPGPRPWVSQQLDRGISVLYALLCGWRAYYSSLVKMPPQGRIPALDSGTTGSRNSVSCRATISGTLYAYESCIASGKLGMTKSDPCNPRGASLLRGPQGQPGTRHWNSRSALHYSRNSPQM